MSILIGAQSKVLVQGITGREGHFHTEQMIQYGTHVVGGVTPGRGGQTVLGVPVFDSVEMCIRDRGNMVREGIEHLSTAPWLSFAPGLAIMATVLGLTMLGDGLRDVMDPKLQG